MSHGNHENHVIPFDTYIKVFSTLIVLTVITVAASRVDFGAWNTIIAFAIATVKALLVLAYFMHLKYDDAINRACVISGVFFLLLLYFFCQIDEVTRIIHQSFV